MTAIRRLSRDLVEKIAAGEVVERPASVVKELLENAIDAGATDVVVTLERGDDLRLSVSDDGIGMEPGDALLAFERHATSKIATPADLESVATLGFRGEALAAIGAVAEVEMVTRAEGGDATRVVVVGGERRSADAAARARGTTVRISRLFFNTPARRKFLKTLPAEVRAIGRETAAHALAAPGVGFALTDGGKTTIRLDAALPLSGRLAALYGPDLAESLVLVADLAGRVALDRQDRVLAAHPLPVVDEAHHRPPAALQEHVDSLRPGIQRVLEQLLHHRRRALDDLARGDAVDRLRR